MRHLIETTLNRLDAVFARCWLTWRYVRAMRDTPRVAWAKARRSA